jgi:hypothetical protein
MLAKNIYLRSFLMFKSLFLHYFLMEHNIFTGHYCQKETLWNFMLPYDFGVTCLVV